VYVIEVERRPTTLQQTEPDGTKVAAVMEPAGPPRWWAGGYDADGRPTLTEDRAAAAGVATRAEAVEAAREFGRWFPAETVRVVDPENPARGFAKRVPGAPPNAD
jgi:hypothetical protein